LAFFNVLTRRSVLSTNLSKRIAAVSIIFFRSIGFGWKCRLAFGSCIIG